MEFFKLQSKKKAVFCLIKLLFIKVKCLKNENEANLEGQG